MKTPNNGSWPENDNHENGKGNGNGESSNGYESRSLARRSQPFAPIRRQQYGAELGHVPMAMLDQQEKRRFNFGDYLGLIWRGKWIILHPSSSPGSFPPIIRSRSHTYINRRCRSSSTSAMPA